MSDTDTAEGISKKAIILYGLLCLFLSMIISVLMYVYGDKIKLGSFSPFSDEAHKWYFIGAVIIIASIIELYLVVKYLAIVKNENNNAKKIKKTQFNLLDEANNRALAFIKKNTKIPTLIKRNVLYEKPWFLFLGNKGSGKTSLLNGFNTEGEIKQEEEESYINWKLFGDSVFLDVRGSIWEKENKKLWWHFVSWLEKVRAKRPVNGIIFAIDIDDFIHLPIEERLQNAHVLRKDINKLNNACGAQIPIYITVTKLDLLEGFSSFVSKLDGTTIDSVLGLSFPMEKEEAEANLWQSAYQEQYDKLSQKLNSLLFYGQNDESATSNAKYYVFLRQMAGLRAPIFEFINVLLGEKHARSKPMVRGVYFTSVHQQADVINAIEKCASDIYNLPNDSLNTTPLQTPATAPSVKKIFFSEYFLREVLMPEAGLVRDNRHEKLRAKRKTLLIYAVTGVVIATLTTSWLYFYKKNKAAGQQVLAVVTQYHESSEFIKTTDQANSHRSVDYLNTLNLLRASLDRYRESQGVLMGVRNMGLYRGEEITQRIATTYQQLLSNGFIKSILQELVTDLEELHHYTNKGTPEKDHRHDEEELALLRVIRLLSESPKGKSQQAHDELIEYRQSLVRPWMIDYWYSQYKDTNNSATLQKALLTHLDYALAHTGVDLDNELSDRVTRLQTELGTVSFADSLYHHLKDSVSEKSPLPFSFEHQLGSKFHEVFQFKGTTDNNSKQDDSHLLIPRFFTRDGFADYYVDEQDKIIKLLALDYWAVGKKKSPHESTETDDIHIKNKIKERYLRDYSDIWKKNINKLTIRNIGSVTELVNLLKVLSSKDSPYPLLVKTVQNNTVFNDMYSLEKSSEPPAEGAKNNKKLTKNQALAKSISTQLQHDFQYINVLLDNTGKEKTYMDDVQKIFGDLYKYMLTVEKHSLSSVPGKLVAFERKHTEKGIGNPIDALERIAEDLPDPLKSHFLQVASICSQMLVSLTLDDINTVWEQEVYAYYEKHIKDKYPLSKSGENIPLVNFKAFFSKNGILDKFHTQYVKRASTAASGYTASVIDNAFIEADKLFEHAEYIRNGFFTKDGEYNITFSFSPVSLSNFYLNSVFDIHGQVIKYSHQKSVVKSMSWPSKGAKKSAITLTPVDREITNEIYTENGEWALFHLIDKTSTYKLTDRDRYIRFKGKSGTANFKLTVPNPVNPLTKDLFTGFTLPEKLTLPSVNLERTESTYF